MQRVLQFRGSSKAHAGRFRALAALALGLALAACDVYDAGMLKQVDPGPAGGTGGQGASGSGTGGGGGDDDGGLPVCPDVAEQCNLLDDDCDSDIDEETDAVCEQTILNAMTDCVVFMGDPRCVMLGCRPGFANCDGDPTNGCEPFCSCNACDDAGTEDGGL